MDEPYGKPFAREDLTVSTAVKTLTASVYKTTTSVARVARITVEAQPIRLTRDGTDPNNGSSPVTGEVFAAGNDPIWLNGFGAIAAFKAIRSGATDAVIHVEYWR